jgi:hypothetical protein
MPQSHRICERDFLVLRRLFRVVILALRTFARTLRRLSGACPNQIFLYSADMTQAVAHILDQFERLSIAERQELRHAIVERVPVSDGLTDDDFAALAAASFRALDEEEDRPRA